MQPQSWALGNKIKKEFHLNINTARKKAGFNFKFGLLGVFVFGFLVLIYILKSLYVNIDHAGYLNTVIGRLVASPTSFLYQYTDWIPLIWDKSKILDHQKLASEGNYWFAGLVAGLFYSLSKIQEALAMQARIAKAERKIEDELLENDARKAKGVAEIPNRESLELLVNVSPPDPWFKKPFGIVSLGIFTALAGKFLMVKFGLM